jgi:hypothetical protein
MRAVCRVGDQISGTCNAHSPSESVTGQWDVGSSISISEGRGMIRTGDTGTASCGHSFFAVTGSSKMVCEGRNIVCVGDTVNIQGGDGVTTTGSGISVAL